MPQKLNNWCWVSYMSQKANQQIAPNTNFETNHSSVWVIRFGLRINRQGLSRSIILSFEQRLAYDCTKFLRFFNHIMYSLESLFIMYSWRKLVVLGLIPLISRYLWKAFCRFSSKSLKKKQKQWWITVNRLHL